MFSLATSRQSSVVAGREAFPRLFPWPALVIGALALMGLGPMLFLGLPSGHDFEFHLNSWMEVVHQWKEGVLYPSWAASAHYGFGEARFLFYPPESWLLGALLALLLPWPMAPAAYMWFALVAAGCAMFLLARRFLPRTDALFVSALYAVNPYHLVIVYWRSAYAELLASCLLPLLLLFVLRSEEEGGKMIVPLALIVAAGWLANVPAAVMINYSLALIVCVVALARRAPRILIYGAAGLVLGAALAGFYLIPAAYEQRWINISEVLAPGVRPQDNFLFTRTSDADHNAFNLLVSVVAVAEIGISLLLAARAHYWRKHNERIWWALTSWAGAAAVLMLSPTVLLWEHLPKLRFVQLPWRWLLALNVAFAIFCAMGIRRWLARGAVCVVMLAILVGVSLKVQPPWWDSPSDITEMHGDIEEGSGYEGTDEYVPAGGDAYEVKKEAPRVALNDARSARVTIERWASLSKAFVVQSKHPEELVIRLFNYPAWKVEVNGRRVSAQSQETTGQMIIAVPSGKSHVRIRFGWTRDRTAGAVISIMAAITTVLLAIYLRQKELQA